MGYIRNKRTGELVFVPDEPAAPQGVPIGPQDPAAPYRGQKAATDIRAQQAGIGKDQATTQRTLADIQNDRERLALARQAAANAERAATRADEVAGRDRNSRVANLRALENQIGTVRGLYTKGPGATKGLAGLQDYLPTPQNKAFDSAGAGLGELGLAAFRVPGVGSQSDAELKAFIEANRPSSRDYDAQIEQKLSNLQNRLGEAYKGLGVAPRAAPGRKAPPRKQSRVIDFNDWKD